MQDPLGDRFKDVEGEWRITLPPRQFYVMRLDGRAFHTFTRGLARPFDHDLNATMDAVAVDLCEEISGTLCAYVQSDEISVVFTDLIGPDSQPWFGGVVQKLVSVGSSVATESFNRLWISSDKRALFDARVFPLGEVADVADYLWWRQTDARRNAVSMLAHFHIGKSKVVGMGTKARVDALAEMGVVVERQDARCINGALVRPVLRRGTTTFVHKKTGEPHTVEVERTVWDVEPADMIRNWFYENHIDRFGKEHSS